MQVENFLIAKQKAEEEKEREREREQKANHLKSYRCCHRMPRKVLRAHLDDAEKNETLTEAQS